MINGLLDMGTKLYQAFIFEDRWRLYLDGLGVTLGITLGAICISTVLGMVLCLMKLSKYKILRWPAQAYIDVIRGIPVVVQLLIMYNVILLDVTDNKMIVAVVAFGLNSSAYMAEIYRSGINAVDPGQMEAGRSLGLSKAQTMWSIIFPQAIKNCLPTYTSEFIVLVKETAVVGYIALTDLTKVYSAIQSKTYDAFGPLLIIAVAYFCITKVLSIIFAQMERRLRQSDRR
ncbi:MAG TPA: amino acid ABC transporter permease [Candidatus Flavonifractor avistercoris]|nr:amino acid ABC transporter permease [Candidatus Flavonifractor avistercoris]